MSEQPKVKAAPKRALSEVLEANAPWLPAPYELADAFAIKALAAGLANEDQQKRALKWIIERAAALYEPAYRAGGEDGRRNTDYALGRQHVGREIVKLVNVPPEILRRDHNG